MTQFSGLNAVATELHVIGADTTIEWSTIERRGSQVWLESIRLHGVSSKHKSFDVHKSPLVVDFSVYRRHIICWRQLKITSTNERYDILIKNNNYLRKSCL